MRYWLSTFFTLAIYNYIYNPELNHRNEKTAYHPYLHVHSIGWCKGHNGDFSAKEV